MTDDWVEICHDCGGGGCEYCEGVGEIVIAADSPFRKCYPEAEPSS